MNKTLPSAVSQRALLAAVLKRRGIKVEELADSPIAANHPDGSLIVWAMLDFSKTNFAVQTQARQAVQLLLSEQPASITLVVQGDAKQRQQAAEAAVYAAWVNGASLPLHKKKPRKPLQKIALFGYADKKIFDALKAQAEGNFLCRMLTEMPPNELTPRLYRARIKKLAKTNKWKLKEFDMKALRKMGAGAFVAVAQGSHDDDAAIVHLSYKHPKAKQTVALVGKGIGIS